MKWFEGETIQFLDFQLQLQFHEKQVKEHVNNSNIY